MKLLDVTFTGLGIIGVLVVSAILLLVGLPGFVATALGATISIILVALGYRHFEKKINDGDANV